MLDNTEVSGVQGAGQDAISISGCSSDRQSGAESIISTSDLVGSVSESIHRGKGKRLGKRRRQRLQRKLAGLELGSISEGPCGSVNNTPKRTRDVTGHTPELAAKKLKTYAHIVAASSAKKFCVRSVNPDCILNEAKLEIFRAEISRRILDAVKNKSFIPRMLGCYLVDSVFVCKCSNEETFVWFGEEVAKIKDIWSGCQLTVGNPPKPLLLQTWVPGSPEEPSVVSTNIGLMNPSVDVGGWKVVRCKREANRQSIVFRVDRKSFDHILGSDLMLQYVLELISFRVISGP
jgi:hypothetical protein